MMDSSRGNATVAALRAGGVKVTELPRVQSVVLSGPSAEKLQPGDLITAVEVGVVLAAFFRMVMVVMAAELACQRSGHRQQLQLRSARQTVERPVEPTAAIVAPLLTDCPVETYSFDACI